MGRTLAPTEGNVQYWMRTFVPPQVLWYWDDSPLPRSPVQPLVIDRRTFRQHPVTSAIEMVNAFHLWAYADAVQQMIVDDGTWLPSLSDADRARVRAAQVTWNRGLCVPCERFPIGPEELDEATFDGNVVLDYRLWTKLPSETKRAVILSELPLWDDADVWDIPQDCPQHIAAIANAFVEQEGINCLAVAAYPITGNHADLLQWMQPEQFLRILRTHGYQESVATEHQRDDVFAWFDGNEVIHASYVLASDRILNKSGQSSFNPIRIVDAALLERDWNDYKRVTFRRTS